MNLGRRWFSGAFPVVDDRGERAKRAWPDQGSSGYNVLTLDMCLNFL